MSIIEYIKFVSSSVAILFHIVYFYGMKRSLHILCVAIAAQLLMLSESTAQDFVWAKQIGGQLNQYIHDKLTDQTQHLVYCGTSNGTADLDPGPGVFYVHGTQTNVKGFISKMDTSGNIVWIDTFSTTGGNGSVWIQSVTVDAGNYIYATGSFRGTVDLDPGPGQSLHTTSNNNGAIFFFKLNPNGSLEWAKSLSGTAQNLNQGYEIIVSREYGIYVAGTFGNGDIDFDPGPGTMLLSAPVRHIFVAKYDHEGALIWAKSYGGDGPEESCVMDTDGDGNLYLAGQFSMNTDFDPGPGVAMPYPNSAEKLYVCKWDRDGNFRWVRCFVGTGGSSYCNDIDFDGGEDLYVCGGYNGTMNFNDGGEGGIMTSANYSSAFVVKLDTAGVYKWSFSIDNSSAESGFVDINKDYYISGYFFFPNVDFDPGSGTSILSPTNSVETFVAKYDHSGAHVWSRAFQSSGLSRAYTLTMDNAGNIYTGGFFMGMVDLDPSASSYVMTAVASDDGFIQKMRQCYINRGISLSGTTLYAAAANVGYSWIDCSTGAVVPGASASSFTPLQTGNYAVVLSNGSSCKDTSDCILVEIADTGTNITELDVPASVALYPNPNGGSFTLELPDRYNAQALWINDALGRLYHHQDLHEQHSIHFSGNLPDGIYFIDLKLKNGSMVRKKMVVQK